MATRPLSLEDLFRSCSETSLTGFAELRLSDAVGLVFYYLGRDVNALYRCGAVACNGETALDCLRGRGLGSSGTVSVYELPLDMAHLLRGISSRKKLHEVSRSRSDLDDLLARLAQAEHTGTLEIQTADGSGMFLLVSGRVSNLYWETESGVLFEKVEARQRLNASLTREKPTLYLAEFSREAWMSRQESKGPTRHRLDRREMGPDEGFGPV